MGRNGSGRSVLFFPRLQASSSAPSGRAPSVSDGYSCCTGISRLAICRLKRTKRRRISSCALPAAVLQAKSLTVLAMLNDVGIDRFAARRPVGCLSSGERTLTALTALCFAPKHLLLLDEPFAFLGAAAVERLAEALSPARWPGTLVYTTSSRAAAESLQPSCFAIVGKGRVVLHDRPPCDADWRAVHEAEIEEAVHASREDEHQDHEAAGATNEAKRQKVDGKFHTARESPCDK